MIIWSGVPSSRRRTPHNLLHKTGEQSVSVQLPDGASLDWPTSISGNAILITEPTRRTQILSLVSVPAGTTRTLIGVPTSRLRTPVALLHDQTLFVGLGHDLIVFDVRNGVLQRYIKDFIAAPAQDNGHGLDTNRIARLMIDRGRLIALTFHGDNTRIASLSGLVANGP
jgi:hypothetical protein